MKISQSKIKKPKCPNCKESYTLLFDKSYSFDGVSYPYLLKHQSNTCPFGLEQYETSPKRAVQGVNKFLKEKFRHDISKFLGK